MGTTNAMKSSNAFSGITANQTRLTELMVRMEHAFQGKDVKPPVTQTSWLNQEYLYELKTRYMPAIITMCRIAMRYQLGPRHREFAQQAANDLAIDIWCNDTLWQGLLENYEREGESGKKQYFHTFLFGKLRKDCIKSFLRDRYRDKLHAMSDTIKELDENGRIPGGEAQAYEDGPFLAVSGAFRNTLLALFDTTQATSSAVEFTDEERQLLLAYFRELLNDEQEAPSGKQISAKEHGAEARRAERRARARVAEAFGLEKGELYERLLRKNTGLIAKLRSLFVDAAAQIVAIDDEEKANADTDIRLAYYVEILQGYASSALQDVADAVEPLLQSKSP